MAKILLVVLLVAVVAVLVLRARAARRPGVADVAAFYASDPPEALPADRAPDFAFLDDYLARWDRFAQGESALQESLGDDVGRFNAELARALRADPARAMGRAVFYPILQVGGFVPLDSAVGAALAEAFGAKGPRVTELEAGRFFFAGDLYFWWEANRARFEPYAPYEQWRGREFARSTVIPMYAGVRERDRGLT